MGCVEPTNPVHTWIVVTRLQRDIAFLSAHVRWALAVVGLVVVVRHAQRSTSTLVHRAGIGLLHFAPLASELGRTLALRRECIAADAPILALECALVEVDVVQTSLTIPPSISHLAGAQMASLFVDANAPVLASVPAAVFDTSGAQWVGVANITFA